MVGTYEALELTLKNEYTIFSKYEKKTTKNGRTTIQQRIT